MTADPIEIDRDPPPPPTWGLPAGRQLLPPDAPRERWLAARRAGIGSSDVPLLMGVANPAHGSEFALWAEKTGRVPDLARPTHAMIRGTWLEGPLAGVFTERTGIETRPLGLCQSDAHPLLLATPDRASADGGVVEIKSIGEWAKVRHEWRHGGVSRAAYVQGQHEVLVTGRYPLWLVAYEIDTAPIIRGPFAPDYDLHAAIIARCESWWRDYVAADREPPVDLATITDDEIAARWPANADDAVAAEYPDLVRWLLEERAVAHARERDAKAEKDAIDRTLRVMAGPASAITIDDAPVVRFIERASGPRVAPEMEWEDPEAWARWVTRARSRQIHIVKDKKKGRTR